MNHMNSTLSSLTCFISATTITASIVGITSPLSVYSVLCVEDDIADHHVEFDRILTLIDAMHQVESLIEARDRWPRGVPLRIGVHLRHRQFETSDIYSIQFADCNKTVFTRVVMTPRHSMWHDRVTDLRWQDGTFPVPDECICESGEVEMYVRVIELYGDAVSDFHPVSFSVDFVDSPDEIVMPIKDETLTSDLIDNFALEARPPAPEGNATVRISIETDIPDNVTIAMRIELIAGNEIVATARFAGTEEWRMLRDSLMQLRGRFGEFRVETDTSFEEMIDRVGEHEIRARVTSDPEYALRDFRNTNYWSGSFIVDVKLER